ncbi:MAG: carbohydrate kinase family protein [Ignavibacteriaceae bacterium]|nr:carbohydrate kinase family protein [Ignavibacteriaceae bacterium]
MKFLLAGSSVEDYIYTDSGTLNQPGGIYYSSLGMLNLKDEEDNISILTCISESQKHLFSDVYDNFSDGFFVKTDKIPVIHLYVEGEGERKERYENIVKGLIPKDFDYSSLSEFDGILLNLITGYEFSLTEIKKFRESTKAVIYLDVHSLSRPLKESGDRVFEKIIGFEEWLPCIDILQANEFEFETLSEGNDEFEKAEKMLKSGVKIILLTLGNQGVRAFFLIEGEINSIYLPGLEVEQLNKVGCGDIFGVAFFFYFLKTLDLTTALKKANAAGGLTASFTNRDNYKSLKQGIEKLINR